MSLSTLLCHYVYTLLEKHSVATYFLKTLCVYFYVFTILTRNTLLESTYKNMLVLQITLLQPLYIIILIL